MRNEIRIFCFMMLASMSLSCLEEDMVALDPEKSVNVVEFKNPSAFVSPYGSKYALYTQAFDLAAENDYSITVSYSGAHVTSQDITVTLGLDTAALNYYNKEQKTHFDLIDPKLYTLPASAVIRKGERTSNVIIKVKSNSFDFSKQYVLPLQIKSVSSGEISGNFGTILVNLNAKNKYDGNYTVTATSPMVDKTASNLTGYYPLNSNLHTMGSNSVVMYCITYLEGLEGHPIKNTNAETGATTNSHYGSFSPIFTMDETGKVINVTNYYGQPATNGRSAKLNPMGANKFTINADGSKTLEVAYVMQQAGPIDRTFFYEKWIFKGPR